MRLSQFRINLVKILLISLGFLCFSEGVQAQGAIYSDIAVLLEKVFSKESPQVEKIILREAKQEIVDEEAKYILKDVSEVVDDYKNIAAEGNNFGSEWNAISKNLGSSTRIIGEAYFFIELDENDLINIGTNYVSDNSLSRVLVKGVNVDILNHADGLSQLLTKVTGATDVSGVKRLRVYIRKPEGIKKLFDPSSGVLRNTNQFSEAEVALQDGRVIRLNFFGGAKKGQWAIKMNKCCVYAGVSLKTNVWSRLKTFSASRDRTQVLSLFSDSKTAEELEKLKGIHDITHPNQLKGDQREAIASFVAKGKPGDPIIVIGHIIEGDKFKIEGKNGFDVPVMDIANLAQAAKRPVFFIGCSTAGIHGLTDGAVTTLNTIYPRKIAANLRNAIQNANSMQDLISLISNKDINILIPDNLTGKEYAAVLPLDIYISIGKIKVRYARLVVVSKNFLTGKENESK